MNTFQRLGIVAIATSLAYAQTALPDGIQKVTSVEGITEYRLNNGLKVLLFPDPAKQTITVNITYLVGSRHEGYGEKGMAHLLEHMMFRGTTKHANPPEEFRKYGARVNGTTDSDRTNYYETFPASDENLRWALELEADRMVNSRVSKQDLDQEMTVVRNEFESGENSPFRVLYQRTMSAAFLWHNYGHSTIGPKSDLENVPVERLRAFYTKHYQPDNAVIVIAGNVDEAKTLKLVSETLGKVPKPSRILDKTYTLDPDQDGERTVTVRRVGDVQALMALFHAPDFAHSDSAPLDTLADIIAASPSGRLHKALVETNMAVSVGGGLNPAPEPGVILLFATVRKDADLKAVRDTLLRVTENVVKEPPTKEEVDRAKNASLSNIERMLTDSDRLGLFLSESIAGGDWRLIFKFREEIRKVTPEDVLRVAKAYLKEDNRTVGQFIPVDKPERANIPAPTNVEAALKNFKVDTQVAAGEVFDASPENIEKRLIRTKLPNGMTLQLLPKKTRGNSVNALVTLHFGDAQNTKGTRTVAMMTGSMLMRGTTKHTRQQLRDELDRLRASMNVFGSATSATASIEAKHENLAEVIKLAAEVLTSPSFPSNEYEQVKQAMLSRTEQRRSEPGAIVDTELRRHIGQYPAGDVRNTPTVDEELASIKAVTLDQIRDFHKRFYGANNANLTVVGDHDPDQIKSLAASLFGDWKSAERYERLTWPYKPVAAKNAKFETPDKANANFGVALLIPIGDEHPDTPALTLANYMFGGGMSGRLFQRIRSKEGLSYGVGSMFAPMQKMDWGEFQAYAISAPQNTAKVESVFREELEKARKEGFTKAELKEARDGYLKSRTVRRSSDAELAGLLAMLDRYQRTMAWEGEKEKRIASLTLDQVNAAFRKYIDPAQLSFFMAGDFAKAAGATPPPVVR